MRIMQLYFRESRGASSAEFALVLIPFLMLVLGITGVSMLFYANQSLQYATEAAARYYSVQTANNNGTPPSDVASHAQKAYTGPGITTSFTPSRGGCGANGFTVTGSATFPLNVGITSIPVSLKSHACFP